MSVMPPPGDDGRRGESSLDPVVFEELRVLGDIIGGDFLAGLVEQFEHCTDSLLVDLGEALVLGDVSAISRIAHNIAGSCGLMGGRRLALSCGRLEARAIAGRLRGGQGDLVELHVDYRDLLRTMEQQLAA